MTRALAPRRRPGGRSSSSPCGEDNRRLREEVERLSSAVRRSLGQQVEQFGTADLGARVDELTADKQQLEGDLAQALARVDELAGQLSESQDDLAASRSSLRRMIRSENQN